jgi:hypothetical protein
MPLLQVEFSQPLIVAEHGWPMGTLQTPALQFPDRQSPSDAHAAHTLPAQWRLAHSTSSRQ